MNAALNVLSTQRRRRVLENIPRSRRATARDLSDGKTMSFADDFVQCMSQAGATIRADSVTEQEHFTAAVQYIQSWLQGLDDYSREGFDAAATDNSVSNLLVDAGIAPDLGGLMADFDALTGWPLTTLLEWCVHCAQQAAEGDGQQGGDAQAGYGTQAPQ